MHGTFSAGGKTVEHLLSKCGFECVRCPAYKGNSQTEEARQQGSAIWAKYFGLHLKPDVIRCEGCQAENPWKSGNLLPDRACPVRSCSFYNGIENCAYCAKFPCSEYSRRVPGPGLRQEREKAGKIKISDAEWEQFLEPFDGRSHLVRVHQSLSPGSLVPPRNPSSTPNVLPFPENINLSAPDAQNMKSLNTMLTRVVGNSTGSYVEQILADRMKPYVAGLLWVIGLYGKSQNDALVLTGSDHPDRLECVRLVKKTDNSPHKSTREAMSVLANYGIVIDNSATKKDWTLTLKVEPNTGSPELLRSLVAYISALVKDYGIPTYAAGYQLKGKAYKAFCKVDMGVFT
jgi:hypothetical protein